MENRKEKLRMVMEEYWRKELPEVKTRVTKLKPGSDLINDVIGPRRAGKTYLMFLTLKERYSFPGPLQSLRAQS